MTVVINGDTGVSGVDGTAGTPALQGNDTNTGIFFPAADTIAFAEGGTEVARFDSSGNLGIGTSSPTTKLHVVGNVTVNDGQQYCFGSNNYNGMAGSAASNIVQFYTNNAERARIDSSGNLLLGTTTLQGRFTVTATGSTTIDCARTETINSNQIVFRNGNGAVGSITTNGSATTYNPSSDIKLKENITPISNGIERVSKLKPVDYNWKSDGRLDNGFIAQDLMQEPEFQIRVNPIGKNNDGEELYGVDYMKFVAVLTAAIQEQQALITTLTERITALEAK
jgi:hypothetical protein